MPTRRNWRLSLRAARLNVEHPKLKFSGVCLLLGLLGLIESAAAQLPATRLFGVFPPGGKQASQFDLEITAGADTEGVSSLRFTHPEITAVQKTQMVEGKDEPQPVANQFTVQIGQDVPLGLYEVRALGTYGISNPRLFVVGDLPETVEAEPNNTPEQPTEIPLGTFVSGRAGGGGDVDYFRFTAEKGQRIIVDCWAERIDSRIDAVLELFDSAGRRLQQNNDFNRHDPLLDFAVPEDGVYLIRIYDFLFDGGNEYFYRLKVAATPYIDSIFPPSALPGSKEKFVICGRNLPEGTPSEWSGADGQPLDQMTIEVQMPDDPAAVRQLDWQSLIAARDSLLDAITYRLETPQGSSNPALISFASAPVIAEVEPNDDPKTAQPLSLPCEWVGRLQGVGDRDWAAFDAKKGDVYWIEVFSQRLGLHTDPYLLIQQVKTDEKGNEQLSDIKELHETGGSIGGLAFNTATDDPVFRFAAPEDGSFRLQIRDLYNEVRGGPRFVYRLSIRSETPDFRLVALSRFPRAVGANPQDSDPWTLPLRKGGTVKLLVMCFRRDNFGGPIELSVEGLPDGVTCAGATIGPGQTSTRLVFAASQDAAAWSGTLRVSGKTKIGEEETVRQVRSASIIWPARGRPASSRLARDIALAVLDETAPFRADAGLEGVELVQSHRLDVPVTLTRLGDFKAKVDLTGAYLPPKVQNEAVSLAPEQGQGTVHFYVPQDAPPGTYTFYIQATSQVPYKKPAEEKPQNRAVSDASTPITVTIKPGPAVLAAKVPNKGAVKRGAQLEISVQVNRRNEFAGPLTLDLMLPDGIVGITAAAVELSAEEKQATLVIQTAADATEGNHAHVALRGRMQFAGAMVEVHQPIPLNVQK